ncbi:phosphoribosyl-AMP cyclohydrolase [Aurantimicrobium minutum]|uniref:phosphoribosyl-AMP cyclohydrolase n=1 Tax=Aurantimicrobium minutum TaxID=708131 RepID=UPI0024753240|nr:phosphoribosyl-AMP cyclohydrolase [Aurantimicrobium minutum]MDH6278345.1 phosphoribosyl-AMP cyclohydrolase [Aurantimicrobium minutum]
MIAFDITSLKFDATGLIPAIIQDSSNQEVLMLGYMNAEAVRRTLEEGRVTFWSRSRQEYWRKGDTSGHAQFVRSVHHDCDADTLLIGVEQIGAACHTGSRTCFEDYDVEALTTVDSSVLRQVD